MLLSHYKPIFSWGRLEIGLLRLAVGSEGVEPTPQGLKGPHAAVTPRPRMIGGRRAFEPRPHLDALICSRHSSDTVSRDRFARRVLLRLPASYESKTASRKGGSRKKRARAALTRGSGGRRWRSPSTRSHRPAASTAS